MKRFLASLLLIVTLLMPAANVAAFNTFSACSGAGGEAQQSTACTANGSTDPISGPNGLLKKITIIIASIAGIAAVIIIIISGIQFITSGGDSQKVAGARRNLIGAIIGLIIVVAAQSILVLVLNRL